MRVGTIIGYIFDLFSITLIYFRFGKRYELPLLLQSIVMNIMMLAMIHLCIKVKNKNQAVRGPDRVFTGEFYVVDFLRLCGFSYRSFDTSFEV